MKVVGPPKGKDRARARPGGGGVYTPTATREWEDGIAEVANVLWAGRDPISRPMYLFVRDVSKRPQRMMTRSWGDGRLWRRTTPDGDNVMKIVADMLQKSDVIVNDKHIVAWYCEDLYGSKNEMGATFIRLYRLGPCCS